MMGNDKIINLHENKDKENLKKIMVMIMLVIRHLEMEHLM